MSDSIPAGDSGSGTPTGGGSPTATATPDSSSTGTITPSGSGLTDTKGPIPYERFEETNTKYNNLRWAEGLDSQRTQQQTQFFQWLDADPEGAFKYMEDYLTRAGALTRQQQAQAAEQRPQPDVVVPETGQRFYSAEAAERLAQWHATQMATPLEQRLQSVESTFAQQHSQQAAHAQLAEANTWPYFKDHQGDILNAMERDHRLSVEGAYNKVVVPKMRQLERQAVLAEIQQKSGASTVNPGSQSAGSNRPAQTQSWSDLFRREMAKRGGQV